MTRLCTSDFGVEMSELNLEHQLVPLAVSGVFSSNAVSACIVRIDDAEHETGEEHQHKQPGHHLSRFRTMAIPPSRNTVSAHAMDAAVL